MGEGCLQGQASVSFAITLQSLHSFASAQCKFFGCFLKKIVNFLFKTVYTRITPELHKVCIVYTEFTHCSLPNGVFPGNFPPFGKGVNFKQILCTPGKLQ